MITTAEIDKLKAANAVANGGRGLECVRQILTHLDRGDEESAASIRQNDGDKILSYPEVERVVLELFGCRTHLKKDCGNWLCVKINSRL